MFCSKKYNVRYPDDCTIIYYQNLNKLLLIGALGNILLILKTKLYIDNRKKIIYILDKRSQNIHKSIIEKNIIDISIKNYKILKILGIGFKVHHNNIQRYSFLQFKLGFSHLIFYKVPNKLKLSILKDNKIYLQANFLTHPILSRLKSLKLPEVYKKKGIFICNKDENLIFKKGKIS